MDIELAYTPVTQAYGPSHHFQFIVLPCCTAALQQVLGGGGGWRVVQLRGCNMHTHNALIILKYVCWGEEIVLKQHFYPSWWWGGDCQAPKMGWGGVRVEGKKVSMVFMHT